MGARGDEATVEVAGEARRVVEESAVGARGDEATVKVAGEARRVVEVSAVGARGDEATVKVAGEARRVAEGGEVDAREEQETAEMTGAARSMAEVGAQEVKPVARQEVARLQAAHVSVVEAARRAAEAVRAPKTRSKREVMREEYEAAMQHVCVHNAR
jgi:hypothetical protein